MSSLPSTTAAPDAAEPRRFTAADRDHCRAYRGQCDATRRACSSAEPTVAIAVGQAVYRYSKACDCVSQSGNDMSRQSVAVHVPERVAGTRFVSVLAPSAPRRRVPATQCGQARCARPHPTIRNPRSFGVTRDFAAGSGDRSRVCGWRPLERPGAGRIASTPPPSGDRSRAARARAGADRRYDPHGAQGQELLGHELAHVVQRAEGRAPGPQAKGAGGDPGLDPAASRSTTSRAITSADHGRAMRRAEG